MENKITFEHVTKILEKSTLEHKLFFGKYFVTACLLPNGFVITVKSGVVSPENFKEEIGIEINKKRLVDKVFEFEGYLLQEKLFVKDE